MPVHRTWWLQSGLLHDDPGASVCCCGSEEGHGHQVLQRAAEAERLRGGEQVKLWNAPPSPPPSCDALCTGHGMLLTLLGRTFCWQTVQLRLG